MTTYGVNLLPSTVQEMLIIVHRNQYLKINVRVSSYEILGLQIQHHKRYITFVDNL